MLGLYSVLKIIGTHTCFIDLFWEIISFRELEALDKFLKIGLAFFPQLQAVCDKFVNYEWRLEKRKDRKQKTAVYKC